MSSDPSRKQAGSRIAAITAVHLGLTVATFLMFGAGIFAQILDGDGPISKFLVSLGTLDATMWFATVLTFPASLFPRSALNFLGLIVLAVSNSMLWGVLIYTGYSYLKKLIQSQKA